MRSSPAVAALLLALALPAAAQVPPSPPPVPSAPGMLLTALPAPRALALPHAQALQHAQALPLPPVPAWRSALEARIPGIAAAHPGELSLYVQDVVTGEAYGHGAEVPTYLSSTIKLVVALEVLRQVDAGTLALQQRLTFRESDVRDGVGPLGPGAIGRALSVAQLLELMLVHSDNAAADRLIDLVGTQWLQAHLDERGVRFGPLQSLLAERQQLYAQLHPRGASLDGAQLRALGRHGSLTERARAFAQSLGTPGRFRGSDLVRAFESFYATRVNSAPLRELGALLAQAARCERLSPHSCEQLHALMRACRTGAGRIRAGLPAAVPWAHKTGTQYQRACDVGFLLLAPGRPVVVAACARDFDRVREVEAAFAAVGAAVWEAFAAPAPVAAQ
ncbi:MAG TPA: serine hydrolase [Aggregicoccus sp.]|nr:serine hydrolase [Aggregicoccus sp.]